MFSQKTGPRKLSATEKFSLVIYYLANAAKQ